MTKECINSGLHILRMAITLDKNLEPLGACGPSKTREYHIAKLFLSPQLVETGFVHNMFQQLQAHVLPTALQTGLEQGDYTGAHVSLVALLVQVVAS